MTKFQSRLILLSLAVGAFAIGTSEFSGMTLLPFYAHDFGRDQPTAAHAVSLYALGVVVGAPLLAILTSGWRRIVAAAALIVVAGIGNILTSMAPTYGWMLVARFASGLPHGAFFGQAALIAAALMPDHRGKSVAFVMSGLTLATVIGAPFASVLGQTVGWRFGFVVSSGAAAISAVGLASARKAMMAGSNDGAASELGALWNGEVWLTLATGAIGFGGLFAVYSYLPAIAGNVAGIETREVAWLLSFVGVGMFVGNLVAGWAGDRYGSAAGIAVLVWSAVGLAVLPLAAPHAPFLYAVSFAIAITAGLGPILQVRLMNVAGEAQTLAAALHHAAFNVANALGPWLAGLAIGAGYGWSSAGPVGSVLAIGGLVLLAAALHRRRSAGRGVR